MSASEFDGFPTRTFSWFEGLEQDNSKAYFASHREVFDEYVRGAFEAMLDDLAEHYDASEVKVFRQHRDVRFSPDKSPYKDRTYGIIGDRPGTATILYAQISSAGLFAGTGYYQLASDQLGRFREGVASDTTGPLLERAVGDVEGAGLEVYGATLKTAPRGYPRDHPRIGLLRHTSLIAGRALARRGRAGIGRDAALEFAVATWDACAAMNEWLERNVGPTTLEPTGPRYRRR